MRKRFVIAAALIMLAGCGQAGESTGPTTPDTDKNLAMNALLVRHGCSNCHASDYVRVGPSMNDVAAFMTPATPEHTARLKKAIIEGAKGNWGEAVMPPQRQVTPVDADQLVAAIFASAPAAPRR